MELLPYVIAGLVTGSVYALTATGLVLTYRTSGVFNFGQGAIATVAAYAFYTLNVQHDLPWWLAAIICVGVLGPLMGLLMELLGRTLARGALIYMVTATVGLLLLVSTAMTVIYGTQVNRTVPPYLPQRTWSVGDTSIGADQLIIIGLALACTVGLTLFLRRARLGTAMRAVVDNPELLDLSGTSPVAVRRAAWAIGCAFASASGVLLSPLLAKLDPISLTFLVVTAFGAAAVGAFNSLPLTYVGAMAIGVGQALCQKWFTEGFWSGLSPALPFIVLFVVLLVLPKRMLLQRSLPPTRALPHIPPPPRLLQAAAGAGLVVFLVLVPQMGSLDLISWTNALAYVMVFSSLGLLVRTSGQVSLAHVTFMAIGVCAMSHLTGEHGVSWVPALLLSGLIAVPIGAVLAIPAIRLSGLYLALATFGFGVLVQFMFYSETYMFGAFGQGLYVPRPNVESLTDDEGFYYLVLAITVTTSVAMLLISNSRLGRLLRGLTESPTALSTAGAAVNVTRVLVFCLSAFIAAMAGALQGATQTIVTADPYQPFLSLILFVTVVVSIGREPWYALIAAFAVFIVPTLPGAREDASDLITLAIGFIALFIGLRPALTRWVSRWIPWHEPVRRAPKVEAAEDDRAAASESTLDVDQLRVRFGGLVAVDGISVEAPAGRITGLIGPNGAGKTTTFNACSGLIRPSGGTVRLDGRDVGRLGPASRARLGLGRTFQRMELFDSMTVRENVELGAESGYAGFNPLSHLFSTPRQTRRVRSRAHSMLALCGIAELADRNVGSLSTGQRRLVELARCLAGPFHLLLLDEPSSGLDAGETERFGEILTTVVRERGVGILIVEHDMSLVAGICDYLYVLDFGKPIFDGDVAATLAAPVVKAAYLGEGDIDPTNAHSMEVSRG